MSCLNIYCSGREEKYCFFVFFYENNLQVRHTNKLQMIFDLDYSSDKGED